MRITPETVVELIQLQQAAIWWRNSIEEEQEMAPAFKKENATRFLNLLDEERMVIGAYLCAYAAHRRTIQPEVVWPGTDNTSRATRQRFWDALKRLGLCELGQASREQSPVNSA